MDDGPPSEINISIGKSKGKLPHNLLVFLYLVQILAVLYCLTKILGQK